MLAKNALLEEIVERLSTYQPSLSTPLSRMQQLLPVGFTTGISTLRGLLAEHIVQHSLEEVCREYDSRVSFPEIPEGAEREHFQFYRGQFGRLLYREIKTGNTGGDFDCLLVVDGLPVLVEVKLTKRDANWSLGRRKFGFGTYGLQVVLSDEYIEHIIQPLQEYFSTRNIGYVVVALPERMSKTSQKQSHFRQRGGYFISFYASRQQYHEQTLPLLRPWVKDFPHYRSLLSGLHQDDIETFLARPLADQLLQDWILSSGKAVLPDESQLPTGKNLTPQVIYHYLFRQQVIRHLWLPGSNGSWQKLDDPQGNYGEFSILPNPWEGAVIFARGRKGRLATLDGLYSFTPDPFSIPVALDCTPGHKSTPGRVKAAVRALTAQEPYLLRCMEALPGQKPGFYPDRESLLPYAGKILLPPSPAIQKTAERLWQEYQAR